MFKPGDLAKYMIFIRYRWRRISWRRAEGCASKIYLPPHLLSLFLSVNYPFRKRAIDKQKRTSCHQLSSQLPRWAWFSTERTIIGYSFDQNLENFTFCSTLSLFPKGWAEKVKQSFSKRIKLKLSKLIKDIIPLKSIKDYESVACWAITLFPHHGDARVPASQIKAVACEAIRPWKGFRYLL